MLEYGGDRWEAYEHVFGTRGEPALKPARLTTFFLMIKGIPHSI